jgi:hypothetical protein
MTFPSFEHVSTRTGFQVLLYTGFQVFMRLTFLL